MTDPIPTPRTEAVLEWPSIDCDKYYVCAEFARNLEREIIELTQINKLLSDALAQSNANLALAIAAMKKHKEQLDQPYP